jgi:hypothetical protein
MQKRSSGRNCDGKYKQIRKAMHKCEGIKQCKCAAAKGNEVANITYGRNRTHKKGNVVQAKQYHTLKKARVQQMEIVSNDKQHRGKRDVVVP